MWILWLPNLGMGASPSGSPTPPVFPLIPSGNGVFNGAAYNFLMWDGSRFVATVANYYPDPLQAKWAIKGDDPNPLKATWRYKES